MKHLKLKNNINNIKCEAHPFHIVTGSSLPIGVSISSGLLLSGMTFFMHEYQTLPDIRSDYLLFVYKWVPFLYDLKCVYLGFIVIIASLVSCLLHWTLFIIYESGKGFHTKKVQKGLKLGGAMFIISEAMLFFSFFWTLFHLTTLASIGTWPPKGIQVINPFHLPLANTVILLSSGVATIWAHRYILAGMRLDALDAIWVACSYGFLFTWLQFIEYGLTNFSINDGAYGSIFFMATGFHGIHIMIGTIFLLICYFRLAYIPALKISHNLNLKTLDKALKLDMNSRSHLGFEFAAWYWHFVDVVWLALYLILYIWSSI